MVVEDDPEMSRYIEMSLSDVYHVKTFNNAVEALDGIDAFSPQLIISDVLMPGMTGFEFCQKVKGNIKTSHIPFLLLTGVTDKKSILEGMRLGAIDYIAKPFDPAELVARVKSHLSRYARLTGGGGGQAEQDAITVGDVHILPRSWKVYKGGRELKMPNREFALLKFLAENPNIVFSKEQLFETIWGYDYVGDSATVTVHVGRIREKIEDDPSHPKLIETVWGAGYRLNR